MEVAGSFRKMVTHLKKTTQHHIPGHCKFNSKCHGNPIAHTKHIYTDIVLCISLDMA
jgi:hypothetical protein